MGFEGVFGVSWGPLGASEGALGAPWRSPGPFSGEELEMSVLFLLLGAILGRLAGPRGWSWGLFGPLWDRLGALWGRFGALLGTISAVLGRSWGPV